MRTAVIGSTIAHLLITIALFAFRMPVKVIVPGPDVVQVALIEPTASPAPVAQPTPPPPEPEDEGIQIEPDKKKTPKKEEPVEPPKKKEPPRTETKAAPSSASRPVSGLPSTRVGPAGLRSDIGTDSNFEFAWYLQQVRDKISTNWSPPPGVSGGTVRSVVYFRIARDGRISSVRLESSSGNEFYDRAAVRAVMVSDPVGFLPNGFVGGVLGVHVGFDWEAP